MLNSEAIQAWIHGKMATSRILVLVSKTEIRSREFSFSSRSLRMKIINLDLVSMPEIGGDFFSVSSRSLRLSVRNSCSRLDVRDWIRETLILVSRMKKWLSLTSECRRQNIISDRNWQQQWGWNEQSPTIYITSRPRNIISDRNRWQQWGWNDWSLHSSGGPVQQRSKIAEAVLFDLTEWESSCFSIQSSYLMCKP